MGAEGKFDIKLAPGYEPELLTGSPQTVAASLASGVVAGAASSSPKAVFTSPSATGTATTSVVKPDRPPQARPLTGRKAASTPSIPEATTYKPLTESFERTVSADTLSSQASEATDPRSATASMTEAGGRENLAAEAVAASVLSSVLGAQSLESPNDNETLSPLLEVVDNLEEDKEMKETFARERNSAGNLNLREKLSCNSFSANCNNEAKQFDNRASSGLDVVSLASTLASDLAHLVETMNLADRPQQPNMTNANRSSRGGRPLAARAVGQEGPRFSKLDTMELSSELNLAFGNSEGTTPTPPPTCQAFS